MLFLFLCNLYNLIRRVRGIEDILQISYDSKMWYINYEDAQKVLTTKDIFYWLELITEILTDWNWLLNDY